MQRAPKEPVWQAHLPAFTDADYDAAVEKLIAAFEKSRGRPIAPGAKKKVGLKIYSDSGPGMATPVAARQGRHRRPRRGAGTPTRTSSSSG